MNPQHPHEPAAKLEPPVERRETRLQDSIKSGFETVKHLTTLNAGSIVVIGTFLTDIFAEPNGDLNLTLPLKLMISISFILFGVSLLWSTLAMWFLSVMIRSDRRTIEERKKKFKFYIAPAAFSFVCGTLSFGAAVIIDLLALGLCGSIIILSILLVVLVVTGVVFSKRLHLNEELDALRDRAF